MLLALAGGPMATAQDTGADDADVRLCRNGLFAAGPPFSLAEVAGDGRAYLSSDTGTCPDEGNCEGASYLAPGDRVVVSNMRKGHACVYYAGEATDTAGYLPLDRLHAIAVDTAPDRGRWTGTWQASGNPEVTITLRGGSLHGSGMAFWPGPERGEGFPSIHTGEMEGLLSVVGNRGYYDDGWCNADFVLLGELLVISDNMRCGGANVTFSNILRRSD